MWNIRSAATKHFFLLIQCLPIVNWRRGFGSVKVRYVFNPLINGLGTFLSVVNFLDHCLLLRWPFRNGSELQIKYGRITLLCCWFIKDLETKLLFRSIWLGHFDKCVNITNSRNEIGNKRFESGFQFNCLRSIPKKSKLDSCTYFQSDSIRVFVPQNITK